MIEILYSSPRNLGGALGVDDLVASQVAQESFVFKKDASSPIEIKRKAELQLLIREWKQECKLKDGKLIGFLVSHSARTNQGITFSLCFTDSRTQR